MNNEAATETGHKNELSISLIIPTKQKVTSNSENALRFEKRAALMKWRDHEPWRDSLFHDFTCLVKQQTTNCTRLTQTSRVVLIGTTFDKATWSSAEAQFSLSYHFQMILIRSAWDKTHTITINKFNLATIRHTSLSRPSRSWPSLRLSSSTEMGLL